MKRKKARPKSSCPGAQVRRVWRLRVVGYSGAILLILLGIRLFHLQIVRGEEFAQKAILQQTQKVPVESRRGPILDRNGQELAVDLPQFYAVGVYPQQLTNANLLCQQLANFTGRPISHYKNRLRTYSRFLYLEWRLTESQAGKLRSLNIGGLSLKKSAGRFYPYHQATSQLLGFTDVDGRGIAGVEVFCDSILQGQRGWETRQRDARGFSFWDPLSRHALPRNGGSVRLSIDVLAQEVLHEELEAALEQSRGQWVGGILLDPRTGDILAVASVPDFDPLRPEAASQTDHKLHPFTDLFEPGSVFKIVGAAAALDQKAVRISDLFYCEEGHYRLGRKTLRDVHPAGWLTFEDVMVNSSNIGMAKLSERIGSRELYRYARRFGFGSPTGIEFPGEASGLMRPHDQWREIDRANFVIGQGISVTMLQMAMSFAAIANDGILMEPRLVLDMTDASGKHVSRPPREVRRVMEPETARTLQRILCQAVERGTGKNAFIEDLQVAGKTGTAQLPNLISGGYYNDRFIASFVGFLPADKPERLLIISVCDPKGAHFGSQVAAPVFKRIVERLHPAETVRKCWQVTPAELAEAPTGLENQMELIQQAVAGKKDHAAQPLMNISYRGSDFDQRIPKTGLVPDLKGLSLRQAMRLLSQCGIRFSISGSGRVIEQSLSPGSKSDKNAICKIVAKP